MQRAQHSHLVATFFKLSSSLLLTAFLVSCGGGGDETTAGAKPVTPTPAPTSTVASILFTPSATVLKADGVSKVTFSIQALNSNNALVDGATINLSAPAGVVLSNSNVVTKIDAAATVTISADISNQNTRVAAISAKCSSCTAPEVTNNITVRGASIALTTTANTVSVGQSVDLSATLLSIAGTPIQGEKVSFTSTNTQVLSLTSATANTDANGKASIKVTGVSPGQATISVSAMGNVQSQAYTSSNAASALTFTAPENNKLITTQSPQLLSVTAQDASKVTFSSTIGTFGNGSNNQTVNVVGGIASVTFKSDQGGVATINALDNLFRSSSTTLIVSPPPSAVNKILFNATETTLPASIGADLKSVTLTATAVYLNNGADQTVANVPIIFSMSGGPGAGERLSSSTGITDSTGSASVVFSSGAKASIPNGIEITAEIQTQGPNVVKTGISPSSNPVVLTIGGDALSIALGAATVLGENADKTYYTKSYSVLVTDANNNPIASKKVTLKLQPMAFSTGTSCKITNTYCSEDSNGNGSLDPGEDGTRYLLQPGIEETLAATCPALGKGSPNLLSKNGELTPSNSDGGSIPAVVTTDSQGVASFTHTYLKSSAIWVINKITATVSSTGTETSKSVVSRLRGLESDISTCYLPNSPYSD
jgi:hypothetical protein